MQRRLLLRLVFLLLLAALVLPQTASAAAPPRRVVQEAHTIFYETTQCFSGRGIVGVSETIDRTVRGPNRDRVVLGLSLQFQNTCTNQPVYLDATSFVLHPSAFFAFADMRRAWLHTTVRFVERDTGRIVRARLHLWWQARSEDLNTSPNEIYRYSQMRGHIYLDGYDLPIDSSVRDSLHAVITP